MDDKRIGTLNEDGSVATWPETSVTGSAYNFRTAPRTRLNATTFVVLPSGFNNQALIDDLRRQFAPAVEPVVEAVEASPEVETSEVKSRRRSSE